MKICDILNIDRVVAPLKGMTKNEILNELIDRLEGNSQILDIEEVRNAVLRREDVMSTNLGNGFAVPHAKTPAVQGIIAIYGKAENPVSFNGEEPVKYFFLLLSNNMLLKQHVKLLSNLSIITSIGWFRDKIERAVSPEEVMNLFVESNQPSLILDKAI